MTGEGTISEIAKVTLDPGDRWTVERFPRSTAPLGTKPKISHYRRRVDGHRYLTVRRDLRFDRYKSPDYAWVWDLYDLSERDIFGRPASVCGGNAATLGLCRQAAETAVSLGTPQASGITRAGGTA